MGNGMNVIQSLDEIDMGWVVHMEGKGTTKHPQHFVFSVATVGFEMPASWKRLVFEHSSAELQR